MKMQAMLIAALGLSAAPAIAQTAPVVKTGQGEVSGTSTNGVDRFLGVPYGADTGGQNRFRSPRPAAPWTAPRTATEFGSRCPQPAMNKPGALMTFSDVPTSEDCLNLNIWAPAAKGRKRPVMVWLHGGAFGFGSSADPYYDGTNLAKKEGVIVVSINHRLNGFGYLNLGPEAGGDFDFNTGQQDIVLALEWVRDNIARFGGDPKNVTLFGQSGGGGKISALLAMPSATGLFGKAIIQSGALPRAKTIEESIVLRDKILTAAGLKPEEVLKLRDLPTDKLVAAFESVGLLSFGPAVDGKVLPKHPDATPLSANVPLMIGTAHDEMTAVFATQPIWPTVDDGKLGMLAMMLTGPELAKEGTDLYKKHRPDDAPKYLLVDMATDQGFAHPAAQLADRKAAQPAPVYKYRIDWRSPVRGGELRSPHGTDVPFVFDSLQPGDKLIGNGESQARMTELMRGRFAAFARIGRPDVKGQPAWPKYDAARRATFIFNDPPSVIYNPDPELRAFWDKVDAAKKK